MNKIFSIIFIILFNYSLYSQKIKFDKNNLVENNVYMSFEKMDGQEALKVVKDSTIKLFDEPTYVKIKGVEFKNGNIEVKVLSRLLKNAPVFARGFIGMAFRIKDSSFECIYIRPANGRADDQVRRNHSVQYFSYPDFKFDKLRQISPEKYETYSDMGLDEWIKMSIEVKDSQAKLFLNDSKYPVFIVNDLKLGEGNVGEIGLWVEVGTEGYFKDLKIEKKL